MNHPNSPNQTPVRRDIVLFSINRIFMALRRQSAPDLAFFIKENDY